MPDRNNQRLNEEIEYQINVWRGTLHGQMLKKMYEGGADYESICEAMMSDYEDYKEVTDSDETRRS